MKFVSAIFKNINNKDKTKKVFQELDKKKIGYLDVEQFFEAAELVYWMKEMTTTLFHYSWWLKVENLIRIKLKMNKIVEHWVLSLIVNLAIAFNMITIFLVYTFPDNEPI